MAKSTRTRFDVASDPGRSTFPVDMLRYDACWPEGPDDVSAIVRPRAFARSLDGRTVVTLLTDALNRPTSARWASYGWPVTSTERVS